MNKEKVTKWATKMGVTDKERKKEGEQGKNIPVVLLFCVSTSTEQFICFKFVCSFVVLITFQ